MLAHTAGMADNLEYRLLLREAAKIIAEPLEGEARDKFLANSDAIINKEAPAPAKSQKRHSFRIVE